MPSDDPGPHRQQTHDAFDGGGLSRPVAADQAHYLALHDRQRDIAQDMRRGPIGIDIVDLKHGGTASSSVATWSA
jgi:hypothetical protein